MRVRTCGPCRPHWRALGPGGIVSRPATRWRYPYPCRSRPTWLGHFARLTKPRLHGRLQLLSSGHTPFLDRTLTPMHSCDTTHATPSPREAFTRAMYATPRPARRTDKGAEVRTRELEFETAQGANLYLPRRRPLPFRRLAAAVQAKHNRRRKKSQCPPPQSYRPCQPRHPSGNAAEVASARRRFRTDLSMQRGAALKTSPGADLTRLPRPRATLWAQLLGLQSWGNYEKMLKMTKRSH